MKIQDFSENYTCLLPQEIQSLHWTQDQCTVYPVVTLRKVNDEIKDDHFFVISDDIKHDVKFVELANIKIDEYKVYKIYKITEVIIACKKVEIFFVEL